MQQSFKLAIQIGASVGASFNQAIRGSSSQLNQLGGVLKKLKSQQKSIGQFQMAEANLGKARVAYSAAAKEVMRLKRELTATQNPSAKLTQAFERAQLKANKLSNKLGVQKDKLRQVRTELNGAGIDTRKLAAENTRLGSTLDKLAIKHQKLTKSKTAQANNQQKRANLRSQLFDGMALGAMVAAPIKIAVDFEQSMAKLGAITRSDNKALKQLETTARTLGETTQFSASQSASAMTFLGMAGFKTNQIIAATPGVLNLAQAAGADLAQTADIASNILSGFSLEAKDMGNLGDVLAATFTTSNTTLQMLGDTLKYAAPVASAAGSAIEEVAAMAGLLGNVGIQGSMAGTVLRAAFLRLSAPPKMAADAMEALGLSVKDAEGNLRGMPDILREIGQATEFMGSAEKAQAIKQLFGSEAAAGMTELLKQAGTGALDDYIAQLNKAQGTSKRMAEQMANTTQGAFKRLGSALESVAISLGSVLLPALSSLAESMAMVASGVAQVSQRFPLLTQIVVGATAGLAALKITTLIGAYAFSFLQGGVLALMTAYRTLSAGLALAQLGFGKMNVMAALSATKMGLVTAAQWAFNVAMNANPIGLIVAGLALLGGAAYMIVKHWEPISAFFSDLWGGITTLTGQAVDWLINKLNFLNAPMAMLGSAWESVTGWMGDEDKAASARNGQLKTSSRVMSSQNNLGVTTATQTPFAQLMQNKPTPLPQVSQAPINHSQRIDAPITIHAQPGMDAMAIAQMVKVQLQHTLDAQQQQRGRNRRTQLFDAPGY